MSPVMMHTKFNRGFTLIELMIVMAIVGILASIAIPMYTNYITRSQVTEGLDLAGGAKNAIAIYHIETGNYPKDNTAALLATSNSISGKYVSSITVADQVITVQFSNSAKVAIAGKTITLTATATNGSFVWACTSNIENNVLPSTCRN